MKNPLLEKQICSIIFSILLSLNIQAQNLGLDSINKPEQYTLELELKGAEYEKLQLIILDNRFAATVINGKKTDIYNWKFIYPSSAYQTSIYMQLFIPTGDRNTLHIAQLNLVTLEKDTIWIGAFNVSPNKKYTASKYDTYFKKNDQFYGGKDVTFDNFTISEEKISEFSLEALSIINMVDKTDTISYQPNLKRFMTLVKENNNSHSLLARLRTSLTDFESKKDVALIYDAFSNEMKNSTFGKQIDQYLNAKKIANMQLPNCKTGVFEPIISNKSPFTLVVFSASWCSPCHKIIPLLKKIYQDLNPGIEIVYISIDEASTVEEWKKLMYKESIPWRSLLSSNDITTVKDIYFVESIPLSYLIHPDKTFETVDIRKEADRKKLYDLFGIPNNN